MKNRIVPMVMVIVAVFALISGCSKEKKLVGAWKLTNGESVTYGMGLKFSEDGKLTYGFSLDEAETAESINSVIDSLSSSLYSVTYTVVNDSVIRLNSSVLGGLVAKTDDVVYSLSGDTLVFDGATYVRVK